MPLEREKILVDNLLTCLNLYQTSLVWALTAAVAFFLLTVRLRAPSPPTVPPLSTAWIGILNALLPPPRQGDTYRVFLLHPRIKFLLAY